MKTITITLLLAIIPAIAFAEHGVISTDSIGLNLLHTIDTPCTRIILCEICGKEVSEEYDCFSDHIYYPDYMPLHPWLGATDHIELGELISYEFKVKVCHYCHKKYSYLVETWLKALASSMFESAKELEADRRRENLEESKHRKIDELKKEKEAIDKNIKDLSNGEGE